MMWIVDMRRIKAEITYLGQFDFVCKKVLSRSIGFGKVVSVVGFVDCGVEEVVVVFSELFWEGDFACEEGSKQVLECISKTELIVRFLSTVDFQLERKKISGCAQSCSLASECRYRMEGPSEQIQYIISTYLTDLASLGRQFESIE